MKTPMNIDTELEHLKKIKRVDAPPFLLTRIEQRISESSGIPLSPRLRLTVISSLIILAIINIYTVSLFVGQKSYHSDIRNVAVQMNLSTSNNLYE